MTIANEDQSWISVRYQKAPQPGVPCGREVFGATPARVLGVWGGSTETKKRRGCRRAFFSFLQMNPPPCGPSPAQPARRPSSAKPASSAQPARPTFSAQLASQHPANLYTFMSSLYILYPYTFIPLHLYTFIPLYPYTFYTLIPLYLYTFMPLYLYTSIPLYHDAFIPFKIIV